MSEKLKQVEEQMPNVWDRVDLHLSQHFKMSLVRLPGHSIALEISGLKPGNNFVTLMTYTVATELRDALEELLSDPDTVDVLREIERVYGAKAKTSKTVKLSEILKR